ncbi:hypothetical protein Tco_1044857 [Tanacetum coccineum]|uniref:Uncharacterized protein n=1 Tax=Tanacetum coccineum TaxID=301880 RepID=A0ABQ5GT29_9ASTR
MSGLSIEIRKIIQEAEELRKSEARARSQKIIIDDDDDNLGFYAKSTSRLAHLAPISPEIVKVCVDDDDTEDDGYDDDFYDCVDIKEEGGEIDLDISKIVDISLREKLRRRMCLVFRMTRYYGVSSSGPLNSGEVSSIDDLPLDDSMILPEYESFTFDDEPVMAEDNAFDEINTSELSYPGIGENVVSDEEEDSFTFTTRTFLPFVT